MSAIVDLWQIEIELSYFSACKIIPQIHEGSNPVADAAYMRQIGPGKIHWFYYPLEQFDTHYWEIFLYHSGHVADINKCLTTALDLSTQLGMDVENRHVPHAWVLSMEMLR